MCSIRVEANKTAAASRAAAAAPDGVVDQTRSRLPNWEISQALRSYERRIGKGDPLGVVGSWEYAGNLGRGIAGQRSAQLRLRLFAQLCQLPPCCLAQRELAA